MIGAVTPSWCSSQASATLAQLDGAQRALGVRLDEDVLARLDEIFPGHKPAPEDYAW